MRFTLTTLKNIRFVEESATAYGYDSTGFEKKRYDYRLTPDGRQIAHKLREMPEYEEIKEATNRLLQAGDPNYMELAVAAKAFFVLKKKKEGLSKQEITREAQKFDWDISPASLGTAISFLERLGVLRH